MIVIDYQQIGGMGAEEVNNKKGGHHIKYLHAHGTSLTLYNSNL